MAAPVHGEPPLARVGPAEVPLQVGLEEGDVGALGDGLGRVPEGGPLRADLRVEVALEAPRVVRQGVAGRVGAEVHRVVYKGALGHAPAPAAAREHGVAAAATAGNLFAVGSHGGFGAVEYGRVFDAGGGVEAPLMKLDVSFFFRF